MEPVDFSDEEIALKPMNFHKKECRIQFCVPCLLECFRAKNLGPDKGLFDDIGVHTHVPTKVWRDQELQTEMKKRFAVNSHCLSAGMNEVTIPGVKGAQDAYMSIKANAAPLQYEQFFSAKTPVLDASKAAGMRFGRAYHKE